MAKLNKRKDRLEDARSAIEHFLSAQMGGGYEPELSRFLLLDSAHYRGDGTRSYELVCDYDVGCFLYAAYEDGNLTLLAILEKNKVGIELFDFHQSSVKCYVTIQTLTPDQW